MKEFIEAYINLWDKRLTNSAGLQEIERDQIAFAHCIITEDLSKFLIDNLPQNDDL